MMSIRVGIMVRVGVGGTASVVTSTVVVALSWPCQPIPNVEDGGGGGGLVQTWLLVPELL